MGSQGERVQSSSNHQKMATAVCKYTDLEKEVESLRKRRGEIISTIEQLSFQEYDLLHKMYLQGRLLKEIAADKKKSYSWATKTHKNALKHLQKLIDERECRHGKKI